MPGESAALISELRRPTIKDVAAKAGVSKSLVSLAYSRPDSVSPKRLHLIQTAAEELGFSPNPVARSLASDNSDVIGILVGDLHNPLFAQITEYVRAQLEAQEKTVFIASASRRVEDGELVADSRTVQIFAALRPASLLILGSIPDNLDMRIMSQNSRIVFASGTPNRGIRASSVRLDETVAMRQVLQHLVAQGHRHITYVAWAASGIGTMRRKAFEKLLPEYGLSGNSSEFYVDSATRESGYRIAEQILKSAPQTTAIVSFNDLVALGLQEYFTKHKRQVPHKIALVSYDNTFLVDLEAISISSVDPGNREIAEVAIKLLANPDGGVVHIRTKPELIIRKSSNFKI